MCIYTDLLSIIFVHGLRGHPRETWEDSPDRLDGDESPKTPNKRKSLGRILKWKRSAKEPDTHDGDTTSLNKVFWPADFLDDDLPTARVWTYGYNADVIGMFEANNTNSVSQHGRDLSVKLERDIQNEVGVSCIRRQTIWLTCIGSHDIRGS